jgi:F5/8 type C domain/Bacterial alpha-L-rhamnosidase 6 hairpin glycosidase domain
VRSPSLLLAAAVLFFTSPVLPVERILDDFDDPSSWTAAPSDGVKLTLSSDTGAVESGKVLRSGKALRMDFDFGGHAGWAAARKAFPIRLPKDWAIDLRLKGETSPQTLEFKLLDRSGQNVWWSVRRPYEFPRDWTTLRIRKRHVSFAWGPGGGGELSEVGFIEITVTAATGGKGTVWLDELALVDLPIPQGKPLPPNAGASSSAPGSGPARALDRDPATSWRSDPASGEAQSLSIDLRVRREFGGLVLDWDPDDFPRRYAVEVSDDGVAWSVRKEISGGRGGRAHLYLPDSDSRVIRLTLRESARGLGYALREIDVRPPEFAETPTAFLQNVARDAPPGTWPRSFVGQGLYWAVVGVDGSRDEGLLSEDGALETGRGGFSLEPFLWTGGKLLGWSGAEESHALANGDLPIPSVTRRYPGGLELEITAFADGPPAGSTLRARYRVQNRGQTTISGKLFLAARPIQVNPPPQFLNVPGGFSPIRTLAREEDVVRVDGNRSVVALDPPNGFGACSFDGGEISTWLAQGKLPPAGSAADSDGFASAAFVWDVKLPAGGSRDVVVAVPLAGAPVEPREWGGGFDRRLAEAARSWGEELGGVVLDLPGPAAEFARTLRSNVAWILVNRDGPAIQPGSRSYSRSWIRDGALTSAALLRLGHESVARDFLRWFAPYQFDDGKVPCCVDRRGADPVPENDSHGELLFLAGEYWRFTRDRRTIEEVWPHLAKAAGYIDALRRQRRTPEYAADPKRIFFGLLPESISHEGYSSHPVHSYWDDFWAVKGLSDAAELAKALGRDDEARRFAAWRDELRDDVHASIRGVIVSRGIDFVPGSAELADLDATSTTIALSPGEEQSRLPQRELARTFEKYWESFTARRSGTDGQEAYTPYEWRTVGAFVRLGWRERAKELMDFLFSDRRPANWNQWAEVVWRNPRAPKFIGDMPHGWVGSDYIRSLLDLFAYDRPEDRALVLGAGVPAGWLRDAVGVSLRGLRTRWGRLDLAMREEKSGEVRVSIAGDLRIPPGGLAVRPPLAARPRRVTVGGKAVPFSGTELVVRRLPAEIVFAR